SRRAAGQRAGREVVHDGTVVRLRPGVPLESEDVTRLDADGQGGRDGAAVAGNLKVAVALLGDEAVVLDGGGPADDVGEVVAVAHAGGGAPALVLNALRVNDVGDMAVGSDGSGTHEGGG